MNVRKIDWFVFQINILSSKKINWKEKKYTKSQRINNVLIKFNTLFRFNKSNEYKLESLNNKEIKKLIKSEYPEFGTETILTSKISYNTNNTRLKQAIFLIDSKYQDNKLYNNQDNNLDNNQDNYTKILNCCLIKSIHKSKLNKYNLIQGILNSGVNQEYLKYEIKLNNSNNIKLEKILKNLMNYFKLIEIENIKLEKHYFQQK